jgi:hypothetical protein
MLCGKIQIQLQNVYAQLQSAGFHTVQKLAIRGPLASCHQGRLPRVLNRKPQQGPAAARIGAILQR